MNTPVARKVNVKHIRSDPMIQCGCGRWHHRSHGRNWTNDHTCFWVEDGGPVEREPGFVDKAMTWLKKLVR